MEKLKKNLSLLFLLSTALFFLRGNAQVTIGTQDDPAVGALLEIKSQDSTKGVLIPKVFLIKYDSLAPLRTGNVSTSEKIKATGMVVYNVNPAAKGINLGIVEWNGKEWVTVGEKMRVSELSLSPTWCSNITVGGYYNSGRVLQPYYNTLIMPVEVDLPGDYTIHVRALRKNGDYAGFLYSATGEFNSTGSKKITLKGEGKPLASDTCSLLVILNGKATTDTCKLSVRVDGPEAKFKTNCSSIQNYVGNPTHGSLITQLHNRTVLMDIVSTEKGGEFVIESDLINGVRLSGRGILEGNIQTVTLYATGTPTQAGEFTYTIKSNSTSSTSVCTVTIKYL
ncbi:MAG: hypothetical protein LBH32_01120 [Dysgonamonadaceae bacterium]|jgi:hypothetical protein|nr:hypothetical protein [Dysgonamonadaceae bacterium]